MAGSTEPIRIGPGWLYVAPVGTVEPTDLTGEFGTAGPPVLTPWTPLGYTEEGSAFSFENTFEDVMVAEELEPIQILQTQRNISVSFNLAELTAANLQTALNGGTITNGTGTTTFEPPAAGDFTYVALAWESTDGLERWIFRKGVQTGNVEIARRKAPAKATIPMSFRFVKPETGAPFVWIHDTDYTPAA
jgi:hypothetical protein